jgi:glutamate dehydrogenase
VLDLARQYFPAAVLDRVGEEAVREHRLRGNIAATELTNRLIDAMGGAGLIQLIGETNRNADEVVAAWHVASEVGRAEEVFEGLRRLTTVTAGVQAQWLLSATDALARCTRWILANADLGRPLGELIDRYGPPVAEIEDHLADLLPEPKRSQVGDRLAVRVADGMDRDLAWQLVCLEFLDGLLPVASLSRVAGVGARAVGELYFGLAADIDFPWLQDRLSEVAGEDLWEQRAAGRLAIELEGARRAIVRDLIDRAGGGDGAAAMADFRDGCSVGLGRVHELMEKLKESDDLSLAALMVAVQATSDLVDLSRRASRA